MFVSTQAVPQIIEEYLTEVIFPKIPSALGQFGMGFMLPYVGSAAQTKIEAMIPALKMLGIVDSNSKIDLEKALESAKAALAKAGGSVTVLGYAADEQDLNSIYQIAKRHASS